MPMSEQFGDFLFPVRGIDLYAAFDHQRPNTTPVGLNVRAFEPSTQRARGGSRPGLVQYIQQQLPLGFVSGSHKIQHLNYIVDPTPPATPGDVDSLDPNAVDDPSDPGPGDPNDPNDHRVRFHFPRRRVRRGGNGHQPNRNSKRQSKRRFIQQASVALVQPFGDESLPQYSYSLAYPNPLTPSSLLVMALFRNGQVDDSDPQPTIADSAGNAFTLAGNATTHLFNNTQIWLWFAINTHGAVANTGTFTVFPGAFTTFENVCFAVLEYTGFQTAGPLDQAISGTTNSPWSLGNVGAAVNDMVLGAFGGFFDTINTFPGGNTMTPGAPYVARSTPSSVVDNHTQIPKGEFWQGLCVCDHIDVQAADGPSVALNNVPATAAGVVCSFKAQ